VRHHQPAAVEHIVADQAVEKGRNLLAKLGRLGLQLRQRLGQPMADLHIAPAQLLHQLHIVVARHRQRLPGHDHGHHQAQHARRARAAIHQVAQKNHLAAGGVRPEI
jgi:hypothetical protein